MWRWGIRGRKKVWKCKDCGHEFETGWIPYYEVSCPKCGSKNVYRIDPHRGQGSGARYRRGICR